MDHPKDKLAGKEPETPIQFRPITDGLGFHPFSDGMPYSPVKKGVTPTIHQTPSLSKVGMGSGAVSAGAPQFAKSLPEILSTQPKAVEQKAEETVPLQPVAPQEAFNPGLIYLFQRVMAFFLDQVILGILFITALSSLVSYHFMGAEVLTNTEALIVASIAFAITSWTITTAQEVILGSTIGKRLFRLGFERRPLRILIRSILFVPCLLFLGLGMILALFNSRRACLHDLLAGIQPIDL